MSSLSQAFGSITPSAFIEINVLNNNFARHVTAHAADMDKAGMRFLVSNDLN